MPLYPQRGRGLAAAQRRTLARPKDAPDLRTCCSEKLPGAVRGMLSGMTVKRMDNVGVVVDDLAAAVAFFKELGLELEGEAQVEGRSVDRLIGLDGVLSDIAMMRTPDGHGRVELTKFRRPTADSAEPNNAPPNTLGIRRIMFAVEDIDDVVARLRAHGAELVGELVQYENSYRLCYVRGPEGSSWRSPRGSADDSRTSSLGRPTEQLSASTVVGIRRRLLEPARAASFFGHAPSC